MLTITNSEASANILALCDERRLTQGQWHERDDEGREIACLLGAIHPSVGSPADCNGKLMPMWLAEITPVLFDGIAPEHIYPVARRYGELVGRWHTLSSAQWDTIWKRVLIRCIDDAVSAARAVAKGEDYWPAVEAACAQCRAAIESRDAKAAARAAARAAAEAAWVAKATGAARAAAGAAAWVAKAAAEATAWAAWAAEATAWTAAWVAAEAARAAAGSAEAAAWATRVAAAAAGEGFYLALFNFILDNIEDFLLKE